MSKQKLAQLKKDVSPYERADQRASLLQVVNTLVPFFGMWFLAYKSLEVSYVLTLICGAIAAGLLTRTFILFHDCCHYSFFKNRKLNDILGTFVGMIVMFPYRQWQREHNTHHATSGNLDKRGTGDMWMLTIKEYEEAPLKTKIAYRIYRNPLIMLGVGPTWVFGITNRFNSKGANRKERLNTYMTNVGIALIIAGVIALIGWKAFLLVHVPIFLMAGALGVWLFYVQHTFEDSYFEPDEEWEYVSAAVEGSSFYKLPKIMQWLTGNIGFHHVHHLSPRIPNYKLEEAHNHSVPLQHVPTITLWTSLQSLKFRLWDEEGKKFVTFREARKSREKRRVQLASMK